MVASNSHVSIVANAEPTTQEQLQAKLIANAMRAAASEEWDKEEQPTPSSNTMLLESSSKLRGQATNKASQYANNMSKHMSAKKTTLAVTWMKRHRCSRGCRHYSQASDTISVQPRSHHAPGARQPPGRRHWAAPG